MIKKHTLTNIRSILLLFQSPAMSLKKLHIDNELLKIFLKFIQNVFSNNNSNLPRKEILNYITSRNMRRTLRPSEFMNENEFSTHLSKMNFFNIKKTLGSIYINTFKQSNNYFMFPVSLNILKFHSKTMLLGNLVSKQFTKKETQEELELSWGGENIFKLITFIKNFDEIIGKNSEVLVFFSAYWCQHCLKLRKPFGNAALLAKEANLMVLFATFDVTTDPDVAIENGVIGIPLIKYYKNGNYVATYRGKRTAEDLFNFVKNPPKAVSGTKTPDI